MRPSCFGTLLLLAALLTSGLLLIAAEPAKPAEPLPFDKTHAKQAELVTRGTALAVPAAAGAKGGWPTYQLTIKAIYKAAKNSQLAPGETIAIKTLARLPTTTATYYLTWDATQKIWRTLTNELKSTTSHIDPAPAKKP